MRAFVAVTDNAWFRFLSGLGGIDEVNFWQPGAHGFKALNPGELFLFKLHYPEQFMVGGGFFAGYSVLPCGLAWDAFGHKNGTENFAQMLARIEHYRRQPATPDTEVGCVLLEQPFFFPRDEWIKAPEDWSKNIVSGKTYNLAERPDLWEAVRVRLIELSPQTAEADADEIFTEAWVRQRLGQGSFRALVTQTYERRCAVTRERILPVLQAAHIRPVTAGGQHRIENGLLLRSDIHTLFDRGYLTVGLDHRLRVSHSLREDFDNGKYYLSMSGAEIFLPSRMEDRPKAEVLEWHRDTVFRG
jgi:putative restriction endonuclease